MADRRPALTASSRRPPLKASTRDFEVIGFRDGFKWLAAGEAQHCKPLAIRDVSGIHLSGGSILGTARTNPTKSETR